MRLSNTILEKIKHNHAASKSSFVANFSDSLLNEFNEVRTNPKQYIQKIYTHINNIKAFEGKDIYDEINGPKIALNKGKQTFLDCINSMENLEKIHPLNLSKDITIIMNDEESEKYLDKKFMTDAINQVKQSAIGKQFNFHYDYGSSNPEISCLLQVVDDNTSNFYRRNNILNPEFNYVGISITQIKKKKFLVYCTFCS